MIKITPTAQEKLKAYLAENKLDTKIRIYLPEGGCGGASQISLSLDQPNEGDILTKIDHLELFMSRDLYELVGQVTIDFKDDGHDSGFVVESEKPVPAASSSDCTGCTCCG